MADLIHGFWWLVFPLGWGLASMWSGWLNGQRRRDEARIIQAYVAAGREPPVELLKALNRKIGEN